jgi:hypothetical protein
VLKKSKTQVVGSSGATPALKAAGPAKQELGFLIVCLQSEMQSLGSKFCMTSCSQSLLKLTD